MKGEMAVRFGHAVLWFCLSLCGGFLVAMITYALILHAATHLPGGSLSMGSMCGYYAIKRYRLRFGMALLAVFGYAAIGVLGWLCALPFMH